MGQKVSPNVLRIGVIRGWENRWYAEKGEYVKWLHQDIKIRKAVEKLLRNAALSKVEIERTKKEITLVIRSARPAVVLGQEGKNVENIVLTVRKTIKDRKADVKVKVIEIKNPDVDAKLVAQFIGEQITNRASFRTVQKLAIRKALKAGAKGIKTSVSGRLGGVEMARTEGYLEGSVPLSTLRSDIDYALYEARTTYGQIGVKVWINHGEIIGKQNQNNSKVIEDRKPQRTPREVK
ncbi:30S ribosomal protein S3 [Spiroplasma diminutum]|uniref:Small ribosomal subunit protein uS3 n=1 Tax=Spiroplasma diminutum CUAS-1 TaxID=1276221 RepID=S5MFA4_9MOLU|nr:30S ribosomal protein S3 [Spiroplasma diminutum]AGR42478.1 30S ribosomal protein S3 [Spiroplasma diminutum CUAS-1]